MEKLTIKVADKTYTVSVARTEEEKEKGLMGVETLPENEGMLFDYTDNPQTEISFWMKDTLIPLDIIFINNQGIVAAITQGEPLSEEQLTCVADEGELIFYVLEVNVNSGIKEGDRFEMSQEEAEDLGLVDDEGRPVDEDEDLSDEELEMFLIGPDFSIFLQGVGKVDWYPAPDARAFWGLYARPFSSWVIIPKSFPQKTK